MSREFATAWETRGKQPQKTVTKVKLSRSLVRFHPATVPWDGIQAHVLTLEGSSGTSMKVLEQDKQLNISRIALV